MSEEQLYGVWVVDDEGARYWSMDGLEDAETAIVLFDDACHAQTYVERERDYENIKSAEVVPVMPIRRMKFEFPRDPALEPDDQYLREERMRIAECLRLDEDSVYTGVCGRCGCEMHDRWFHNKEPRWSNAERPEDVDEDIWPLYIASYCLYGFGWRARRGEKKGDCVLYCRSCFDGPPTMALKDKIE